MNTRTSIDMFNNFAYITAKYFFLMLIVN